MINLYGHDYFFSVDCKKAINRLQAEVGKAELLQEFYLEGLEKSAAELDTLKAENAHLLDVLAAYEQDREDYLAGTMEKRLREYIQTIGEYAYAQHRDGGVDSHSELYQIATMCRDEQVEQALNIFQERTV